MGKCLKNIAFIILIMGLMCVKCFAITDNGAMLEQYLENAPEGFEFSSEDVSDYAELKDKIDFDGVVNHIMQLVKSELKNCIGLFVSVSVIVLLFSVLDSFEFNSVKTLRNIVLSIISIAVLTVCFATIKSNIDIIKKSVESMNVFTTAAVPVVGAFCIAGGEAFSSAIFSTAVSFSSSVFEYVAQNVLLPLIILYLSFGIIGNLSDRYNIISADNYIKRFIKWAIGIFAGIFTFSISLQSFLSHSSDTLVKRSVKTAVGSFIPVVGSTLSGGIDSMFTLAANSKTSFAILGIVIILFIFLPPIIGNVCYGMVISAAKALAAFLRVTKVEKTLGIIADTFFLLAGICSTCVYMVIMSFLLICINIV